MTFLSFSMQMIKANNTGPQETVFLHWNQEGVPPPTPVRRMSTPSPPMSLQKKKTTRRAGSCEPCRKSKIKCDGKLPECTGCSRRKRAKCKDACVYVPAKERSAATRQQQTDRIERRARSTTSPLSTIGEDSDESDVEVSSPYAFKGPPISYGKDEFFGASSLARCIDKFKSICPVNGTSTIPDAVAHCNGIAAFDALPVPKPIEENELLLSRSQHSLNHYLPGTDLRVMPPEIRSIGWKAINMKERMVDEGRLFEAYKDFPCLAREARFFRRFNIKSKSKISSTNPLQAQVEQKIYRIIVDMDIRICTHLGMPLEVQRDKIPSCTTLTASDGEPSALELENSQSEFRQLALDILTLLPNISAVDEGTTSERTVSDLSTKWDHLRELCSKTVSTSDAPKDIRLLFVEHQIDRLALSMLLACTLGDLRRLESTDGCDDTTGAATRQRKRKPAVIEDGYTQMALQAAQGILALFTDLKDLSDECSWTCAYAVFCAAAIISIAIVNGALQPDNIDSIKYAVDYFGKATRQQGKGYGLASAPLAKLWAEVKSVTSRKARSGRSNREPIPSSPLVKPESNTVRASPAGGRKKRRSGVLDEDDDVERSVKRSRRSSRTTRSSMTPTPLTYGQDMTVRQVYHQGFPLGYNEPPYGWTPGYDVSASSGANVSFGSSMPTEPVHNVMPEHPEEQPPDGHYFHYKHWYHPPLEEPQPPYVNRSPFPDPGYNNSTYYQFYDLYRDAVDVPMMPRMPDTTHGATIQHPWTVPGSGDDIPGMTHCNIPPQESRRTSVVSQHDNTVSHLTNWQNSLPTPHYQATYPDSMFWGK